MIEINPSGIRGECKAKDFKKEIEKLKELVESGR